MGSLRVRGALLVGMGALALSALSGCATTAEVPKLMTWKVEASHEYVMAGEATDAVVNIELGARMPEGQEQRVPLNLSLVLDHSGSMSGEQMEDARQALTYILGELHPEDTVSVIAFSTRAVILQEQAEWDDVDQGELFAKIKAVEPIGTTAMQEALGTALGQVHARYDGGRINRIILLSDGIPNDATQLTSMAQSARSSNIGISTFGLGPFYNEDLMAQLADLSGGNYRFIQKSEDLETFFLAEKKSMEQIVARNVHLQVNLGPGIEVVQTLGAQATLGGRAVSIFIGDFGASDERQIALRVKVTAPASGANVEMIDAQLIWEDVVNWGGNLEHWAYLQAKSTKDQALIDKHHNKIIEEKVGRLEAAWQMEQAIREFEAGKKQEAERRLRSAAQEYRAKRDEASAYYEFQSEELGGEMPMPQAGSAAGLGSWDSLLEEAADELDESEPESDEGKVLIKKSKAKSRTASGL